MNKLQFKHFVLLCLLSLLQLSFNGSSLLAQGNVKLAEEYFKSGELEKARSIYEDLLKDINFVPVVHANYLDVLVQLQDYKAAEKHLSRVIKLFPDNLVYRVDEVVYLETLEKKDQAKKAFQQILEMVKADQYKTRLTAQFFINKRLFEFAIQVYQEARKYQKAPQAYAMDLANIYRFMNKKDLMVDEYLTHIKYNPSNLNYIKNVLQATLTEPEDLESMEMLLLDKVQKFPDDRNLIDLLIWNYMQQKNFFGAFVQARALEKRMRGAGSSLVEIGQVALDNRDYANAIKIFTYITDEFEGTVNYILARRLLIKTREEEIKNSYPVNPVSLRALVNAYDQLVNDIGLNENTFEAYRSKALLHAFYLDEKEQAIQIFEKLIATPRMPAELLALSKLDLGDIYLLLDQPWESTLLYSQVEKQQKESNIGHEAKLRNAKLSYFKGEFQLAQQHLDILKLASTREIANDAIELSVFIKDHSVLEADNTPLLQFSKVELLIFQNKKTEALAALEQMYENYPSHSLADDILWAMAKLELEFGRHEQALIYLEKIVEQFSFDILSDEAYYTMGKIYEEKVKDKTRAMEIYQDFLVRFPDSIFLFDARKRFRILRGDVNF